MGVRESGRGRGASEGWWWVMQLHISAKLLVSAPNGHFITWSWEKSHAGKLTRISPPLLLCVYVCGRGVYHHSASELFPLFCKGAVHMVKMPCKPFWVFLGGKSKGRKQNTHLRSLLASCTW